MDLSKLSKIQDSAKPARSLRRLNKRVSDDSYEEWTKDEAPKELKSLFDKFDEWIDNEDADSYELGRQGEFIVFGETSASESHEDEVEKFMEEKGYVLDDTDNRHDTYYAYFKEKVSDDSFEAFNEDTASTEEIAEWAEQFVKPVVEAQLKEQGEKGEVEVKVDGDQIRIEAEGVSDSSMRRAIRKVKIRDSKIRKVLGKKLKVKDEAPDPIPEDIPEEDQPEWLEKFAAPAISDYLKEHGVECTVEVSEDGTLEVEPVSGKDEDKELADSFVRAWGKSHGKSFIKDDEESEKAKKEGGQGGPEDEHEEEDAWKEHERGEELKPKEMEDWVDEMIAPAVEAKLEDLGVDANYEVHPEDKGVVIDLASKSSKNDEDLEEGQDELVDSITKVISSKKVKDSKHPRHVVLRIFDSNRKQLRKVVYGK